MEENSGKNTTNKSTSEKAEKVVGKVVDKVVPEEHKDQIKTSLKGLFLGLKRYLNIREGVDIENTVEAIKKDVEFKGYNAYILIFSIFIASIGLNVNSTAVIIGAMLISPLMGPIVGVGLAVGTTDIKLLTKSLKNLGATVLFSVATATIYFLISPISEDSHELLARTTPTLLDALVAIFGGLAGIMASSRKEKTNAVPGVAIATALMPPLCTAGYGLATGHFQYFFGAFYLFLLNSIFISLSTVIVVRYVGFPRVDFINPDRERKVKRYIYAFIVIVITPSAYIFWNVIQESLFNQRAQQFVREHIDSERTSVINSMMEYDKNGGTIKLFLMGERLSNSEIQDMEHKMVLAGLENTQLIIRQDKDISGDIKEDITGKLKDELRSGIIEDMYNKNQELLKERTAEIEFLKTELTKLYTDSLPDYVLSKEVYIEYPEMESNYFATIEHRISQGETDSIPTVFVHWKKGTKPKVIEEKTERLGKWLAVRLRMDSVKVVQY